ncbi:MAG: 8-amino-7-oxononanoate synthase, partial [Alistipes sp.]|nr:8-amino-7-oxononanoate synthase [Alistipes sp.]
MNPMQEELERLSVEDNLRSLPALHPEGKYIRYQGERYLNLSSNDYLGLSCSDLHRDFMARCAASDEFLLSNPSSRLITGNSDDYRALETSLSELFDGASTLVLGCGYMANTGVLPA